MPTRSKTIRRTVFLFCLQHRHTDTEANTTAELLNECHCAYVWVLFLFLDDDVTAEDFSSKNS